MNRKGEGDKPFTLQRQTRPGGRAGGPLQGRDAVFGQSNCHAGPPPIAIAAGRVWERSGSQWHIQRLHRFWPVGGEAGLTAPAPMESAAGLTAPAPLDPETGLTAPAPLDHQASLADPSTTASPFSVCSSARDGGCRAALATFSIQVTTDAAWFWRAAGGSK